jgi:hypothetical protein
MVWKDIIDLAVLHKQMSISEVYAKKWFNEGKKKLAYEYDTACKKVPHSFTVTDATVSYDLPTGCLRIKSVKDSNNNKYTDFYADDTSISFEHEDVYNVVCLLEPDDFKGSIQTAEIPEIRPEFWPALAKYIASSELSDCKPSKATDLYNKFLSESETVDMRLKRMSKGTGIPRPVPKFR